MTVVGVFLLFWVFLVLGDKHSLFYLFTVQSDPSVNNIYQFSVETLLDDTQLDSYSSRDGIRTPKQSWVKEIEESELRSGTENLKNDGYLLHEFLVTQMEFSGHKRSERHVLQWRLGCEGETLPDGSVSPLNGFNEIAYDGEDLISYNWTLRNWRVSASQSSDLEKRWKNENGYLHSALSQKYGECLKWLKIYLHYNTTVTKPTVPDVYVFVNKSQTESSRLTLTCLATGFYPKDLKMRLRRFTTSLPDHLLTSSGVRPNGDGTYQLRKSVDVQEEDRAGYDCYVEHSSFNGSMIKPWERKPSDKGVIIGAVVGAVVVVVAVVCVFIVYKQRENIIGGRRRRTPPTSPQVIGVKIPLSPVPLKPAVNISEEHNSV
ncbi:H-2 class I histocompatibility antigen, alpha chain-like [Hoplias malabaricus]|uniref:H-2 class I histocompatibility antigen, alpha chain-like n=1 Tax=Hoplias malabaricus TaxID=27720 RepID=UPI0034623D6A